MSNKFTQWFRDRFNTILSDENERRFHNWIAQGKQKYGVDLTGDLDTYDLRGYWLNGGYTNEAFRARKGHAPDTFKKPNHPTFSNESIYHGKPSEYGGTWQGGVWSYDGTNDVFTPSAHMLQHTHPEPFLTNYMSRYEPKVKLVLPRK